EFQREIGGKDGTGGLSHIFCENAPVSVVNCRFVLRRKSGALICAVKTEPSHWMHVRNCQFLGDWHTGPSFSWAASGSRMVVSNCIFLTAGSAVHVGILRDAQATAPALVQVDHNTMWGGALFLVQTAGWKIQEGPPKEPRVRIEAAGNICGS